MYLYRLISVIGFSVSNVLCFVSFVPTSGYLLISEAQPSDSGEYSCVVTNTAGSDTAIAKVIVTGRFSVFTLQ